ncbi:hypothetical protein DVH05_003335 [Phytophthora capsici]|nr:hypothetical protein DVH05_003335 [Phytophthora capsici]
MEAVHRFAFLKTSVGGTASFVYGATDAAALGEQVSVDRVTSGRWADLEPYKADVPMRSLKLGSLRRTPQNVAIGNSIFDEEVQSGEPVANGVVGTPPVVDIERGSQGEIQQLATDMVAPDSRPTSANTPLIDNTGVLSELDEDSNEVSPTMERSGSVGVLRRRPASEALCPKLSRLQRLPTNFAGDPDMQRELDQFILFRETGLAGGSASSLHTQGQAAISAGDGGV